MKTIIQPTKPYNPAQMRENQQRKQCKPKEARNKEKGQKERKKMTKDKTLAQVIAMAQPARRQKHKQ